MFGFLYVRWNFKIYTSQQFNLHTHTHTDSFISKSGIFRAFVVKLDRSSSEREGWGPLHEYGSFIWLATFPRIDPGLWTLLMKSRPRWGISERTLGRGGGGTRLGAVGWRVEEGVTQRLDGTIGSQQFKALPAPWCSQAPHPCNPLLFPFFLFPRRISVSGP